MARDAGPLLASLKLLGLLRGGSLTATVPAANLTTGVDSAIEVSLFPLSGKTPEEEIILERIATQAIAPSNLTITVKDKNREQGARVLLDANLQNDEVFVGDATRGIVLTIRNNSAAAATVVLSVASITQDDSKRLFAAIRGAV